MPDSGQGFWGWLAEILNQIAAVFCVNSRVAAVYCWSALLGRFVLSGKGGSRMRFCLWWSMCWYFSYMLIVECVGGAITWLSLTIKLKISCRHLCAVMLDRAQISDWIFYDFSINCNGVWRIGTLAANLIFLLVSLSKHQSAFILFYRGGEMKYAASLYIRVLGVAVVALLVEHSFLVISTYQYYEKSDIHIWCLKLVRTDGDRFQYDF